MMRPSRGSTVMLIGRMNRRDVMVALGSAAAWPIVAHGQQPPPTIGILNGNAFKQPSTQAYLAAFREGLASTGFVEGQNVRVEFREADGHDERLPDLAAELVKLNPAVIIAVELPAALAAKAATTTIPIVFIASDDPVKNGLVASLEGPGGNATGINPPIVAVETKRVGLLHELVPDAARLGALFNPNSPDAASRSEQLDAAGDALGLDLVFINVAEDSGLEHAFAWINEQQIEGVLVAADPLFASHIEHVVALAREYKLPAIYATRLDAVAGGLMSYGPSLAD